MPGTKPSIQSHNHPNDHAAQTTWSKPHHTMAGFISQHLEGYAAIQDAVFKPPPEDKCLDTALFHLQQLELRFELFRDDLLQTLTGEAKQIVQAIIDWAPTYANALKDIPNPTASDENPARRNLEHLHRTRDAIDRSGALTIETALNRLPNIAIQLAVSSILTQILPPQYQAQALVVLFPIIQTLQSTFADQTFPEASRQAILWRRIHEHIVESSEPLLTQLSEEDRTTVAQTDRNLKQAIKELSRSEQPTTTIAS